MGERGCNKGFPDTGRPCDQNIQVSADPAEIAYGGQQRRVEVSRETVVQILQTRRLRQCRHPQTLRKAVVVALGQLVLQQQIQALLEAQRADIRIGELSLQSTEHAVEFEFGEQLQQWFDQHGRSPSRVVDNWK